MNAVTSATGAVDSSTLFAGIINLRQKIQAQRMKQGADSGQVTDAEQARLDKGQSRVDALKQEALSDGVVTGGEFARIMHAQNRQSRHIFGVKHNEAGQTVSNASLSLSAAPASASNASAAGATAWADMGELMRGIAGLRQDLQAQRIQDGLDGGQLSPEELQKLKDMQTANTNRINDAMADGSFTPREFAGVIHAQNKTSRHILRYRHNQSAPQAQPPEDYAPLDASA